MERFKRQLLIAGSIIIFYMTMGTIFFHLMEGWSYVDSFYFSGVTLTTVGYGDITPTHNLTKIAAVIFAFSGISVVFYSVSVLARHYFEREEERLQQLWTQAQEKRPAIVQRIKDKSKHRILRSVDEHTEQATQLMRNK